MLTLTCVYAMYPCLAILCIFLLYSVCVLYWVYSCISCMIYTYFCIRINCVYIHIHVHMVYLHKLCMYCMCINSMYFFVYRQVLLSSSNSSSNSSSSSSSNNNEQQQSCHVSSPPLFPVSKFLKTDDDFCSHYFCWFNCHSRLCFVSGCIQVCFRAGLCNSQFFS